MKVWDRCRTRWAESSIYDVSSQSYIEGEVCNTLKQAYNDKKAATTFQL